MSAQLSIFGRVEAPHALRFTEAARTELAHGAWVEHHPGWLGDHAGLFEHLLAAVRWQEAERPMYDRTVTVPRLIATSTHAPALPIFGVMRQALDTRYGTRFERLSFALYRDGRDSVAYHGDYVARRLPEALVATVSLGAPRRCSLRPTGGGASVAWNLGFGDLFVMGGTCQRTWQHAIPKAARADARIAIMYRPIWSED